MLTDTLTLKLDIEEIKKKLANQDKNIELVFNYLDELMEKQEKPIPRERIGFLPDDEECNLIAKPKNKCNSIQ